MSNYLIGPSSYSIFMYASGACTCMGLPTWKVCCCCVCFQNSRIISSINKVCFELGLCCQNMQRQNPRCQKDTIMDFRKGTFQHESKNQTLNVRRLSLILVFRLPLLEEIYNVRILLFVGVGKGSPSDILKPSTYFTESRTNLPLEAIGPKGNCFSRGVRTSIT